jgi:hypothetical protein
MRRSIAEASTRSGAGGRVGDIGSQGFLLVHFRHRNRALAAKASHMDACFKRGERDAHIRWVRRNARVARAKDCMHAIARM